MVLWSRKREQSSKKDSSLMGNCAVVDAEETEK
jgi:hypothetical protein